MIRNVVLIRMSADAGAAEQQTLDEALRSIRDLQLPGLLSTSVGYDAGLRAGGWTAAIVNDWVDAAAYRRYDLDETHNVHRAAIVSVAEEVARVQLEVDAGRLLMP